MVFQNPSVPVRSRVILGLLLNIMIGAAILGIIIAVMEGNEFPGWVRMVLCVLSAVVPAAIVNSVLPEYLFVDGMAVGALCAGYVISKTCGMSLKRSFIAAGLYLVIQSVISSVLNALL